MHLRGAFLDEEALQCGFLSMHEFPLHGSVKKMRVLTVALIMSGALNIGVIVKEIVSQVQSESSNPSIRPVMAHKTHFEMTLDSYFAQMEKISFHELVSFLTNRDLVEEGYLKRDLALSALVAFHHFNLDKALSGVEIQKRDISFQEGKKISLFPGLSDVHFDAIIRFAYEEKWPLTTEGLFKLLRKWPELHDESLSQAFFVTPEFRSLEILFQKTENSQPKEMLLQLISEGPWDLLAQFAKQQGQILDLSIERRRTVLLNYVSVQSKTAAYMLLKTDFAFVVKRFGDEGMVSFLTLLSEKTEESEKLCIDLLRSPRSDSVWESAATALYRYEGEPCPSSMLISTALARFIPNRTHAVSCVKNEAPCIEKPAAQFRQHIVKEGESLWKIARQYSVKVDDIVRVNEMEKDRLYPGMILRIP